MRSTADFKAECDRRRSAGLTIEIPFQAFAVRKAAKEEHDAIWDNRAKQWLLPDAKALDAVAALVAEWEGKDAPISTPETDEVAAESAQEAPEVDTSDPTTAASRVRFLEDEVARLRSHVRVLEDQNAVLKKDILRSDADHKGLVATLGQEIERLKSSLDASRKAAPGHDLDEATCRKVAEAVGRGAIDAALKALGTLRRKPTEAEEAARIALATRASSGVRPLDLDEAPKAPEAAPAPATFGTTGTVTPPAPVAPVAPAPKAAPKAPEAPKAARKGNAATILGRLKK